MQVEVKIPVDRKYLEYVLDGRMTQDFAHQWVHVTIKRRISQIGPLELRVQVAGCSNVRRTHALIEDAPDFKTDAFDLAYHRVTKARKLQPCRRVVPTDMEPQMSAEWGPDSPLERPALTPGSVTTETQATVPAPVRR